MRILAEEADAESAAVESARRSLSISTKRYRGGVASYLEVLTAQTIQLTNERAQAEIVTRRFTGTVQLIKALGGGWSASNRPIASNRSSTADLGSSPRSFGP